MLLTPNNIPLASNALIPPQYLHSITSTPIVVHLLSFTQSNIILPPYDTSTLHHLYFEIINPIKVRTKSENESENVLKV